jgi:hypothetical protein
LAPALRRDERAWAAWPEDPAPPEEPFDRARCAAAIRAAKPIQRYRWDWREPPFTYTPTREEAGAWLQVTFDHSTTVRPAAKRMAGYDEPLPTRDEAFWAAVTAGSRRGSRWPRCWRWSGRRT